MQRERLCPFYPMAGEVTAQGQLPHRSIFFYFLVLQDTCMSSQRGILKCCPFLRGGELPAAKAYKSSGDYPHPFYPAGGCGAACQGERPDWSKTFCRMAAELWHGAPAKKKCGPQGVQSEIMSLSHGLNKPAHIH